MISIENFPEYLLEQYNNFRKEVPSMTKAHRFIDNMTYFLFPFKIDKKCTLPHIELNMAQLQIDLRDILTPLEPVLEESPNTLTQRFLN